MERRAAAGEAGDGDVEAAPEQVDGAALAEEGRAEALEHAVDRQQRLMEARDRLGVIGAVAVILGEGHRVGDFVRAAVEARRAAEVGDQPAELLVELGDGHRPQREGSGATVAGGADNAVIVEVEQDLDAGTVMDHRRRQPARRDIEGRMPGVVDPRRVRQPILAGDLEIEVQRRAGVAPAEIVEAGPEVGHHCCLRIRGSAPRAAGDRTGRAGRARRWLGA